jgi:hypothetical protein
LRDAWWTRDYGGVWLFYALSPHVRGVGVEAVKARDRRGQAITIDPRYVNIGPLMSPPPDVPSPDGDDLVYAEKQMDDFDVQCRLIDR